jgi:O-succinylbenzoate synthase
MLEVINLAIQIQEIILRRLKMRLNNPFTTSFGTVQDKEFFIIEAVDYDGNHGFGESVAFSSPWYTEETVQTNEHIMEDFLINILQTSEINHPDDISMLFRPIKRNNMAKAGLEGAIWDLYAKQKKLPLSKALGGLKSSIEAGISLGIESSVEELLQTIRHYVQIGYKRIKLKIKPGYDIEVLRKVRRYFPNLPIMADANSAYTLHDIDHLKNLDELNLMMIEQPLAHDDIIDHANLQAEIQTPICLDESIHSFDDARKAIQLGSCQILNIKIGRVGGLTEAKRIHDYCLKHNVAVWCGGMLETGIGRAHNIALATLAGFTLPGDIASSSRYWKKDIIKPEVEVNSGIIHVPTQPGIGYNIDYEILNQFTVDKKSFSFS